MTISRPLLSLGCFGLFLLIGFGVRVVQHFLRTGRTGVLGISREYGAAGVMGGVLFLLALALGALSPLAGLFGWVPELLPPLPSWCAAGGVGLACCGFVGAYLSQSAMGDSWRIGVRPTEATTLVESGPFSLVRNPIYTFTALALLGGLLLVPNWVGIASFVCLIGGLELQVRYVEEPYLLTRHGEAYRAYARRVGRFLPGLGRLE
jgi:protein-S-isoprenylcysteine O-methyltransferase Ste14